MLTLFSSNFRYAKRQSADIVVIGGGVTGVGVAYDAARRGFRVILIEKGELGSGTSGRFHGLLHSGARYAVEDFETAVECIQENRTLRNIAAPAILDTGGLFLALDEEELAFSYKFVEACQAAGIPIADIPLAEAVRREPTMARPPLLQRVLAVPDGYIDGAKLLKIIRQAAEQTPIPARFMTHQQVVGFRRRNSRLEAVTVEDQISHKKTVIECNYVINAAGAWAGSISRLAGITIKLVLTKGTMVVFEQRLSNAVLNRCRPQSNGDILVPDGKHSIMGTTTVRTDNPDNPRVEQWEIDLLLREGQLMVPSLSQTAIRTAYAGVRPLFGIEPLDAEDRSISRSYRILDHADEGINNFISIVGGKATLYRRMAEAAMDVISQKQAIHNRSDPQQLQQLSA